MVISKNHLHKIHVMMSTILSVFGWSRKLLPKQKKLSLAHRFRGLLPIVIDVETSGLNPDTDALLELAVVTLTMTERGELKRDQTYGYQVEAFPGAHFDPRAMQITGIDAGHPFRYAVPELQVLHRLSQKVSALIAKHGCQRAVLVGHNSWFDLSFLLAAAKRCAYKSLPFHSFTSFDTATLGGAALGETVLARAVRAARIHFDVELAHSAIYDAEKTAELFCYIINGIV